MRRWTVAVLGVSLLLAVALSLLSAGAAFAGTTRRASVSSTGAQGDGDSWCWAAVTNGYVAFLSNAPNLVADDTNATTDVFVRDLFSGQTERVSVSSSGEQALFAGLPMDPSTDYREVSITPDGRYVAFASDASNLVPDDTNGMRDVFVRDRVLQATERVSVDSAGQQWSRDSGHNNGVPISADGRYVAFVSVIDDGFGGVWDVYVRDRQEGTTECVSNSGSARGFPAMSPDGRFVVFSGGDGLGTGIFLRDRLLGTTELISITSTGEGANAGSYDAWVSADGRYVAFDSYASNMVADDTNGYEDVFLRDRQEGTTVCVSVNTTGAPGTGGLSGDPTMSADGRFVAFPSFASDLVPGDTNGTFDTFVRDMVTGTTVRVSLKGADQQTGGAGGGISADGRSVCMISSASDLVEGDSNGAWDVFVRHLGFSDVPVGHWAFSEISACVDAGLASGYKDGTFQPTWSVSRDQMAVFLARGLAGGEANVPSGPAVSTFTDVGPLSFGYRHIEYVASEKVAAGFTDGTFAPRRPVTRGQMAAFIARSMEPIEERPGLPSYTPPVTAPSFPDVAPDNKFYKAVEYVYEHGVTHGMAGYYQPDYGCTRAQMAVFLAKAFGLPM